jgi:hypothetical protein
MPAGATARAASTHHDVSTRAIAAVTSALSTLSARSWRVTRPPLAPSARRTAISRALAAPRASARLAMLAQASSNRHTIAPNTSDSSRRLVRVTSSASDPSSTVQPVARWRTALTRVRVRISAPRSAASRAFSTTSRASSTQQSE